ncbi:MAG: FAD-dependent oxidoreductase, partial [Candidatus Marinimicrobia bacterium]|nr:FAD-dependent oxidoreductase [Candidatus Neomarinimicrobiota bacterium]
MNTTNGNGAPKIGVYICHCGINIASKVDIDELVTFARGLPLVAVAREYKFMCSDPGQELIQQDIRDGKVNRVVVASCSPLMHESTFRQTTADAGENPFLFQMANIREHVSWVTLDKTAATRKSMALVAAAVHRVALHVPLEIHKVPVHPDVMVVGGGIAGIQAALTMANADKKVYLVEREPTIGGHMAQFDKTFPTLDCSACILTPKMTQVRSHPNIELLSYSEVEQVDGYVGNFQVKVRKKSRLIHEDICNGCAECAEVCPVELDSEFDAGLGPRKAVYRPFPQAVPNSFTISRLGTPPCSASCSIHQNAQAYLALIAQRKYAEALTVILRDNPLPSVCGRVCTHPCTVGCNRNQLDEALDIPGLKRFVMDWVKSNNGDYALPMSAEERPEKVAIVGSGPAGLMCAFELRQHGYQADVFEALPVAGGMLAAGIPAFRLPRHILEDDIRKLEEIGITIRLNSPVGENGFSLDRLNKEYDAVFVGIGAHKERQLNVPGEKLRGVHGGIEFLWKINQGEALSLGKRVLIIGGGNSALDAARTVARAGAEEVRIVYRRTRSEMPADQDEIDAAIEEGVQIDYLTAPLEFLGDKRVSGLRCQRMKLGPPDKSGRPRP